MSDKYNNLCKYLDIDPLRPVIWRKDGNIWNILKDLDNINNIADLFSGIEYSVICMSSGGIIKTSSREIPIV